MPDKKIEIVKTIIIAVAIITASLILGKAINDAGFMILQGLDHIATSIAASFLQ